MAKLIAALPFYGDSLSTNDPSSDTVVDNGGTYDATYSTGSLNIPPGESAVTCKWPTAADLWFHTRMAAGLPLNPITVAVPLVDFLLAGVVVARIRVTGFTTMTLQMQTLQSGVLTDVGSPVNCVTYPGLLCTLDWHIVSNTASGVVEACQAGTIVFTASADHSGFAGIDQIKRYSFDSSIFHDTTSYWSETCVDSVSTVGRNVRCDRLDTDSATNTGWTGTVGNVNELPTDDSTYLASTSATEVRTCKEAGLSAALSGRSVIGRATSARMRVQGTGPPNIDLAQRVGSTNYFATAIAAGAGFQACFNSWATNPAGGAWTPSTAVTEVGAKSAA